MTRSADNYNDLQLCVAIAIVGRIAGAKELPVVAVWQWQHV
jgi:hypothetical protein